MLRGEPDLDPELEEKSMFDTAAFDERPKDVAYNPRLPIETFDFVFTDECHRSIYHLWRQVLEYFDAFVIGLTATPSKQTFGFFNQNLVMEYNHERAVADGVNASDNYLAWAPRSTVLRRQFDAFRLGTGVPRLNIVHVRSLMIPIAPLVEQDAVLAEVEARMSVVDAEEKAIEAARLRQSILKRAFEGKLVPQDPSDEPAERLLERIRAEKAKHAAGQPRGRGRRTASAGK
jgi:hypothetical protein